MIFNTPESTKSITGTSGVTSSTATGNGSQLKTKHEVYLKRLKSLQNGEKKKFGKWSDLKSVDYNSAFSDQWLQSLSPKEISNLFSSSKCNLFKTNSEKKQLNIAQKAQSKQVKTHRNIIEVPEFKIRDASPTNDNYEKVN